MARLSTTLKTTVGMMIVGMAAGCASRAPYKAGSGPLTEADLPPGDVIRRDVDRDGLVDVVYRFPRVVVHGAAVLGLVDEIVSTAPTAPSRQIQTELDDLPPAIVARGRADGRFTFDDPVSRAALRALCPEPPPLRTWPEPTDDDDFPEMRDRQQTELLESLFIDAYCHRVWGASIDVAVAHLRESITETDLAHVADATIDAIAAALRKAVVPHTLAPLAPRPLPEWPDAPPFAEIEDPAPPTPRCAPVMARWQTLQQQVTALAPTENQSAMQHLALSDTLCAETPKGTWAFEPGTYRVDSEDGWSTAHVEATLSWQPEGGPIVADATVHAWYFDDFNSFDMRIVSVFDLDHDGLPEVFLQHVGWSREGADSQQVTIHSVRDGHIVAYPHTPKNAVGVADIDNDGRPDPILPSPWGFVDRCGHSGIDHPGPSAAAHTLADGRFAYDDKATRAWLRAQCVTSETGELPDVIDIACARLAGFDPEAIVAALHAVHPAGPVRLLNDDTCFTFQELAAQSLIGFGVESP